jgi:hypothetical protein
MRCILFYYDYYAIVIQKAVQIVTGLTSRTSVSHMQIVTGLITL